MCPCYWASNNCFCEKCFTSSFRPVIVSQWKQLFQRAIVVPSPSCRPAPGCPGTVLLIPRICRSNIALIAALLKNCCCAEYTRLFDARFATSPPVFTPVRFVREDMATANTESDLLMYFEGLTCVCITGYRIVVPRQVFRGRSPWRLVFGPKTRRGPDKMGPIIAITVAFA